MELPSSGGLQTLQSEPTRLRAEGDKLQTALEELYRGHYVTFIENHECMEFLDSRGRAFQDDLDRLDSDLAAFKKDCSAFEKGGAEIVGNLKRSRQTLQHHLQLVELLEVPQLMDACVRNNLYEEAIEMVAFANTLERRHLAKRPHQQQQTEPHLMQDDSNSQASVVIASIVGDLRVLQRQLREKLLLQLRSAIQLPKCLQVISCLRKLDGLVLEQRYIGSSSRPGEAERSELEHKLQVEFLEARDAWLQSVIDGGGSSSSTAAMGPSAADVAAGSSSSLGSQQQAGSKPLPDAGPRAADAHQVLMDVIEKNRTHWFEIATQFRAIFLDDDVRGSGAKNLSVWLLRRIDSFIAQLEAGLSEVTDGAAMADLLEQCMFFGSSMSRIGVDFRELLMPVFVRATRELADLHWTAATEELKATLQRCHMQGPGGHAARPHSSFSSSSGGVSCYVMPTAPSNKAEDASAAETNGPASNGGLVGQQQQDPLSPPLSILTYPPLSQYSNLVLTSFNQLRQCTPWAVVDTLEARFLEHLRTALKVLSHHRLVENRQAMAYKQLVDEAMQVMVPYLLRCFTLLITGEDGTPAHKDKLAACEQQVKSWSAAEGLLLTE